MARWSAVFAPVFLGCAIVSAGAAEVRRIHVAVDGNDAADGMTERPAGTTGPVRSLDRARNLVREQRALPGGQDASYEVVIGAGVYPLSSAFVLEARDSGRPGAPVVYRAADGADVRLSGGVVIAGWKDAGNGQWTATFDPVMFRGGCPTQLFVNGVRRERPRLPAQGTFAIAEPPPVGLTGRSANDYLVAAPGDLADLKVGADTEVVILDAWTASRMRATGFDPATRKLSLSGAFVGHGFQRNMVAGLPYYLDNATVERLSPGSWRCDAIARTLSYAPQKDEALPGTTVVVPRTPLLLALRGTERGPVHDIRFERLVFEHAAWSLPPGGWAVMQAEVGLPAAIEMEHCRGIALLNITAARLGANGIGVRKGCSDVEVSQSVIDDLGGGGLAIGSDQRKPAAGTTWESGGTGTAETHHVSVVNNRITRLGRIQRAAVGVWSGQAHHVTIRGNFIRDLYYTGISMGWSWNSQPSLSHHNVVEGNIITKFGQRILSDFGGIYMLGRQDESRVTGNRIFDGQARKYGGNGLYADEGSANMVFADNVISNTSHAAIHLHFGENLLFERNTAREFGEGAIRCSKKGASKDVRFSNNVFFGTNGVPFTYGDCMESAFDFQENVYVSGDVINILSKKFSERKWSQSVTGP